MYHNSAPITAFVFMAIAVILSGCGSEKKDEVLGLIIIDCQLNAHNAMDSSPLTDEKKHFAIGEYVERCLKENGLQPFNVKQGDESCFETPKSTEEGKGFIKPLQKCWNNVRSSKS
jgi:hypothetical protein